MMGSSTLPGLSPKITASFQSEGLLGGFWFVFFVMVAMKMMMAARQAHFLALGLPH